MAPVNRPHHQRAYHVRLQRMQRNDRSARGWMADVRSGDGLLGVDCRPRLCRVLPRYVETSRV